MRLKCEIAYDGYLFNGFQIQPNGRTIQGEIELALTKLHKNNVKIFASGRTDAFVHAKGQVFHFDTDLNIPIERWPVALQTVCPEDITILNVSEVEDDFHARFDVTSKEYRYFVWNNTVKDVFRRNYVYHYPYVLSLEKMLEAKELLIGTHDFSAFCSAKATVESKVRTIYSIEINKDDDGLIQFSFQGNGFLYNMVRILVGTLINVGNGKIPPKQVETALITKNRRLAGHTAPGHGLYLWKVNYNNSS